MQSLFFDHVNSPSQRVFQVGDQSARKEGSRVGAGFNEEIKVAVRAGLVVSKRPEDLYARNSMAVRDCQNSVPVYRW